MKKWICLFLPFIFLSAAHSLFGGFAYVTNNGSNNVSIINTLTQTVVNTVPVGTEPRGLAFTLDGKFAYIANSGSANISIIDTATQTVVNTLSTGFGSSPTQIVMHPNGRIAYALSGASVGTLSVIDLATQSITDQILVGITPFDIAILPDGSALYISSTSSPFLSIVDTQTLLLKTINVGSLASFSLNSTPDGAFVYVATSNGISIINTTGKNLVKTIPLGLSVVDVEIAPNGTVAYFGATPNLVGIVNTASQNLASAVTVGSNPTFLAFTPDSQFVYVSNTASGTVSIINTATQSVVNTVTVGGAPQFEAMTFDGLFNYVINFGTATVNIINTTTQLVASNPAVGVDPIFLAFQPLLATANLQGKQVKNRYLKQTDIVNVLTWTPSPAPSVIAYNILRDGVIIAQVPASSPLVYRDHNRQEGVTTIYSIIAVNSSNEQGSPTTVIVSP